MSFFCDIFSYFKLNDYDKYGLISYIPNIGIVVYGGYKIENLEENKLLFVKDKKKLVIEGDRLKIKHMSSGEIVVEGCVKNISGD